MNIPTKVVNSVACKLVGRNSTVRSYVQKHGPQLPLTYTEKEWEEALAQREVERCVNCGTWLDSVLLDGDGFCEDCMEDENEEEYEDDEQ